MARSVGRNGRAQLKQVNESREEFKPISNHGDKGNALESMFAEFQNRL